MNAFKIIVILVLALAVGQVTDWVVADHLALALLVLLVAAAVWTRLSLQGISVIRKSGADRAQVGQSLRETLSVRNAGRLAKVWVELRDQSNLPGHDPGRVVRVPGRSAVEWDTRTVCVRRGRYHLGPIEVRSGDPLGIFTSRLDFPETPEVIVYPAVVDLREASIPEGVLSGGSALERRTPHVTSNVAGVRDYAQVRANGAITPAVTEAALQLLEVDEHGFDEIDRRLLRTIIDKFDGGPVGLNTIAAALGEERDAIEEIYEPFLIQIGFLDRTPRGRVATPRAYEYFGLANPGKERKLW